MAPKNSNIKDVARRAGVSIATVSYVLNNTKKVSEETRRRVLQAVQGLQYQPNPQARSLRLSQGREVLVLVEEACLGSAVALPLMAGLVTSLQKRHSYVSTYFFDDAGHAAAILQRQDFYAAFVITVHPAEHRRIGFGPGVLILNLSLEECAEREAASTELDLGTFFYEEVDSCLRSGRFSQVVMNYRQGGVFKRLSGASSFENMRLMGSEISSGAYYLQEVLDGGGERILFADYALFVGAAKYLLQHEEVLFSRNLEIEYLPWSRSAETYGLPLAVRALPVDEMLRFVLEKSLSV